MNQVQIIHSKLHSVHSNGPVQTKTKLFMMIFTMDDDVSGINLPVQRKERKVIEAVSSVYNLPLCSYPQANKKSVVIILFAFTTAECNIKWLLGHIFNCD